MLSLSLSWLLTDSSDRTWVLAFADCDGGLYLYGSCRIFDQPRRKSRTGVCMASESHTGRYFSKNSSNGARKELIRCGNDASYKTDHIWVHA